MPPTYADAVRVLEAMIAPRMVARGGESGRLLAAAVLTNSARSYADVFETLEALAKAQGNDALNASEAEVNHARDVGLELPFATMTVADVGQVIVLAKAIGGIEPSQRRAAFKLFVEGAAGHVGPVTTDAVAWLARCTTPDVATANDTAAYGTARVAN